MAADPSHARVVLSRSINVDLPVERALPLFTPAGERLWVDGWDPRFPAGEAGDGAQPGAVFVTRHGEEETLWVVVERSGDLVRYARTTAGSRAGIVEVRCTPDPAGGTRAVVSYDLTALTPAGAAEVRAFADGYDDYIDGWEREIAAALADGRIERAGS